MCVQSFDYYTFDVLYHKLCSINHAVKNNKRVDITIYELDTTTALVDEPLQTELYGKGKPIYHIIH